MKYHTSKLKTPKKPSDVRITKRRLKPSDDVEINDCTMLDHSSMSKIPSNNKINTSIASCRPTSKRKISHDKLNTYTSNIMITSASKKSQVEPTSNAKSSIGFWKKATAEWSKMLWLPTEIDSIDSLVTTLNGYSTYKEPVSWSMMSKITAPDQNSLKTSFPSSIFSPANIQASGGNIARETNQKNRQKVLQKRENLLHNRLIKKDPTRITKSVTLPDNNYLPKCIIVKLNPTIKQKRIINDWIAAYRKTWNLALRDVNDGAECNEKLRDKFVIQKNMSLDNINRYNWLFRTGKRIREYGVKDLVSSYTSCQTKVKKGQIKSFNIKYKSKSALKQGITISHESTYILPDEKVLQTNKLKIKLDSVPLIYKGMGKISLDHNLRLTRVGSEYYIHIPQFITPVIQKVDTNMLVSIDPGVDVFSTFYSPQGECGEIGRDVDSKIGKLRERMDKIIKRYSLSNSMKGRTHADIVKEKNKRLNKAVNKIKTKIINMVDDFHWKLSHWLLKNYDKIFMPRLYVQKGKKLKERQADLRHCQFVDRLIYKSMFYDGKKIYDVKEHWTSKTCTRCGNIKMNLGTAKVYICRKCNLVISRDLNGARNILLKNL